MGMYVNPGNRAFAEICGPEYVDKTGLIHLINERICGPDKLVCISRPRRFGKSYAAKMLTAYYDSSCNSHHLFDEKEIAKKEEYEEHLNQYNVIYLEITSFISSVRRQGVSLREVPNRIVDALRTELVLLEPGLPEEKSLTDCILYFVENMQKGPFVFVIDEWDAMIREAKYDPVAQRRYLDLLRELFKNGTFTPKAVACAYMTGILPIKKDGSQSAISDFKEFSMLEPLDFAEYIGFTEEEVMSLCSSCELSFESAKRWYDGYSAGAVHSLYNPYSVMSAIHARRFKSYWKRTSAAEALMTYIDMDMDGLQDDIVKLAAGDTVEVDIDSFQNDVETFTCKDDVLTLLIHLGYLTYEEASDPYDVREPVGLARIPNEEVRIEFEKILRKSNHAEIVRLVRKSDQLMKDTLAGNSAAVAKAIKEVHETIFAPTYYNEEQALRYAVKIAYIAIVEQYAKVEELPSGHGIADIVFLPRRRSVFPAMVIELKWNKSAEGAIRQIKDRNYQSLPEQLGGEIVLVGINYDEKTTLHTCVIERVRK